MSFLLTKCKELDYSALVSINGGCSGSGGVFGGTGSGAGSSSGSKSYHEPYFSTAYSGSCSGNILTVTSLGTGSSSLKKEYGKVPNPYAIIDVGVVRSKDFEITGASNSPFNLIV